MLEPGNEDNTAALIAQAMPWIDSRLAAHGIARTGPPGEPRVRTWATVIPMTTDHGTTWFKAASGVTAHEIGLYPLLVAEAPGLLLHPLATDPARAWMLLPDGGTSLMHAVPGDQLVEWLVELVPSYARLQRSMEPNVHAMLGMGVPDMRPGAFPDRFDEALAATMAIAHQAGNMDDVSALRQVAALRPRFLTWTDALVSGPVSVTIDHSDLHANNLLLPDGPTGQARIYDWGDSVVAHPFSTLLVMLRSLMDQLQASQDDPRITRVRDAYLDQFSDCATHVELLRLVEAACWTSAVIRAVTWLRVLELGPPPNPDWSSAPIEWMRTFLNESWLD